MPERILLKTTALILSLLCAVVIKSSAMNTEDRKPSGPRADVTQLEKKIHTLINKERLKKGLSVLLWDENLHNIARRYSLDMVQRDFFSHNDPEGRTFCDRYKAARFECRIRAGDTTCLGAENIALDNLLNSPVDITAESVVKRWMSSRGHRRNILTPYFKRHGIGVALSEDGKVYVTENFC